MPAWRRMLAERPVPGPLWVLAYGSLIWKPEVAPDAEVVARIRGYHRRFCLWQWRSRGLPERPCLMMALDRGGACVAVAHRFDGDDLEARLFPVWQREMRGGGYQARWLRAEMDGRIHPVLAFVANRSGRRYAGRLDLQHQAEIIAGGCGPRGACADYLYNTVQALAERGIHDRGLWALERKVAGALTS